MIKELIVFNYKVNLILLFSLSSNNDWLNNIFKRCLLFEEAIMKPETIQTLHPDPGKTNKKITMLKYESIKAELLLILSENELTHTDLMEALYQRVKDTFKGGVQWYGETVKLDLEARNIIERTKSKPQKYRLVD